jgi:diacylglycerol kinase (ATP)
MNRHIALVCNPTIENAKSLQMADEIAVYLKKLSINYSLFTTYWPQVWNDFTDAWIVGGDGTLNYFINENPDIKLPLAVFNAGTGNDFHWMLYDDTTVIQQVNRCLSENYIAVDAGLCNGKLFLNGVGIGFDGAIVKDLLGKKKIAGNASYLLSILKNIMLFHEKEATISFNDNIVKQPVFMVSVANGKRYGGGFLVAPRASLQDGLLDLNIVGKIDPVKRMRYLPVIEKGEHLDLGFIKYHQASSIIIETAVEWPAHIDGEFISANKFEISILSKKYFFSV